MMDYNQVQQRQLPSHQQYNSNEMYPMYMVSCQLLLYNKQLINYNNMLISQIQAIAMLNNNKE